MIRVGDKVRHSSDGDVGVVLEVEDEGWCVVDFKWDGEMSAATVNLTVIEAAPAPFEVPSHSFPMDTCLACKAFDDSLPEEIAGLVNTGEVRIVDPETGGMKGQKLARFSSIPKDVLTELAEHHGKGQAKYPDDPETGKPNWQKGYDYSLNIDALYRHMTAWEGGEDFDPETGSSHLIAVMWHAQVLRWFQLHGKGRDTR